MWIRWLVVLALGLSGCGDDDVGQVDAGGAVCPALGRPEDGTPCASIGTLCFYDYSTRNLVFECASGSCSDAPPFCGVLVTECGWPGFGHLDTASECTAEDAGDEDAAGGDAAVVDANVFDANGNDICPAVGRPADGTPCALPGALCYYDGEGNGRLLFTCPSGHCPNAPCGLFTECEGNGGFHHWDSSGCDGSI